VFVTRLARLAARLYPRMELEIASVDDGAAGRRVDVGFRDTDAARSQRISANLLQLIVEANFARRSSVVVQVLSPPSAPTLLSRFDQLGMTLAAAALGTLLGVVVLLIRRPAQPFPGV
jgi:hypothetical protein